VLNDDGRMLVRYIIKNKSKKPYVPGIPEVVVLEEPHFPISLASLTNCQIGSEQAGGLDSSGTSTVSVHPELLYLPTLSPGQELTGIISVTPPSGHTGPTVLRFAFPNSGKNVITAILVL
jgi:hypothetical protein